MNARNQLVISRREVLGTALASAGLALGGGLATADPEGAGTQSGARADPPRMRPIPSSGELLPVIGLGTNAYSVTTAENAGG